MIFELKAKPNKAPLLNERIFTDSGITTYGNLYNTQPFSYSTFMVTIKKTPEAIGILQALTTDIISDGVIWHGGKNKILKAKEFCSKMHFWTERFPEVLNDWFIFGNALIWPGVKGSAIKDSVYKEVIKNCYEMKEQKQVEIANKVIGEISEKSLDFRPVPWSTVSIINSNTDITGFKQSVTGAFDRVWKADELIHAKLMNMDGRVYGYSPMISATSVLSTLSLIKDYNGYYFDNGGVPDFMFIFPNEYQDNPSVETLRRNLQEKKKSVNKHGSMVITGDCKVQPVGERDRDMEYRLLSIYYTGILAFAHGMPLGRVQSLIGSEVKGGGGNDLSDSGYWRCVSHKQRYWEEVLNGDIFEPNFGARFKFKRSYKQDEVRESQAKLMSVQYLQNLLSGLRIKPSNDYIKTVLALDDEDVDFTDFNSKGIDDFQDAQKGNNSFNNPSNDSMKTPEKQNSDDMKRKTMSDKTNTP